MMETVLLASFLTQYDAIKATFKEMKPFLNISEETGRVYYRLIFTLKIIFVVYAFDRAFQKPLSLIFKHAGNLCRACKNPIFREIFPNILSALIIFSLYLYKEPLISISAEFLTDILLLIFSSNYAVEAYKKELQKISSIIFMCLFVQWSINHASKPEHFTLSTYFQVLTLVFLSFFPMMPYNPKYRPRLSYLYILMYIWVFYKLNHAYRSVDYVRQQNKIKGALGEDLHTMLEPERGKIDETLQNLYKNNESICSDTENISSCYTQQRVVPRKAVFPSNQEQNITENLEQVFKPTSYSKGIQDEGTRNTMKSDISEVAGNNVGITETGKIAERSHEMSESNDANFQPEGKNILNGKRKDLIFKRHGEISEAETSEKKENELGSKVRDDEIYKNILVPENKEMTAQSEPHFEEVTKSRSESTDEENDVTGASSKAVSGNEVTEAGKVADSNVVITEAGKIAERGHETSESNDANFKPLGMKILNGKRKIPIFKRHGKISVAAESKKKENELGSKVGSDDRAIQMITHPKNKSPVIIANGMQGTVRGSLTNIVHKVKRSGFRIGRKDGTELQIKNGASKGRLLSATQGTIKPGKVPIVKLAKKLLPKKVATVQNNVINL